MKEHNNLWKCPTCEKRFSQKAKLNIHLRIHTGIKPFDCSFCDKAFRTKSLLTEHERVHTGEKPFECSFCGRRFSRRHHCKEHELIHTGDRPFECSICARKFSRLSTLTSHQTIHISERPYACLFCPKRYKLKKRLNRHQIVHTGDKLFKYSNYEKQEFQNTDCTEHTKTYTGGTQCESINNTFHSATSDSYRSFLCKVCEKSFSRRSTLQDHMQMHIGTNSSTFDISHKYIKMEERINNEDSTMDTDSKPFNINLCTAAEDVVCNERHRAQTKIHMEEENLVPDTLSYNDSKQNSDSSNRLSDDSNKFFHLNTHFTPEPFMLRLLQKFYGE